MDILCYIIHMNKLRKIATNIPTGLLEEAVQITGLNQTQTLIEGLKELIARNKRQMLLSMSGKIRIGVDTDVTRRRTRS